MAGMARYAATVAVALAMAPVPVSAEPEVKETIAYYDVSGSTPQELRKELNRFGPFDRDGRQWDAVTKWYVNWRYQYNRTEHGCRIASATSEAKVNITMPRLKQESSTPDTLRQSFEGYSANLLVHEKGHGQFGIDAARRIEEGLINLPAEPTCKRMGEVANEFGRKLIREASQQDIDYDAQTQHGATQGARFP